MRQWLLRSDGSVKLFIPVNIQEDIRSCDINKHHRGTGYRVASLLHKYEKGKGKENHAKILECMSTTSEGSTKDSSVIPDDSESDRELYEILESEVYRDDWVGSLAVEIEFRELKDSRPQRRGGIVVSHYPFLARPHRCLVPG
ncbi:uncharacterized protein BJX67DRAFT_357795 [Aspergillus lucknowensis]|uniref:Uncharacterized protein n=1 Tax=Aspergillus lucknowensis TaxID=176173 RepID=A0ABR4LMC4_9EURO